MHLHAPLAQHVREAVVLLAGPAHPQHVVEEQRVLVAGREPLQLQIWPVEYDAAQPPGLGIDMESHAPILSRGGPRSPGEHRRRAGRWAAERPAGHAAHSRGSTGSDSRARTAKTASWTRHSGSPPMIRRCSPPHK